MPLFKTLLKTFNRLRSGMREKQDVQLDDYILEHFLLYHGLVGSMPENQRDFKDVRADFVEAINHASAEELSIALKVPPLWWEDRLAKILDEVVAANREGAVSCLLAANLQDDVDINKFPLRHLDWRVRANTARLLARLEILDAVPFIAKALSDTAPEQKPAFCHLAHALSKLQTEAAKGALVEQLENAEPWFRVDAAGALAHWPRHAVAHVLMEAMLQDHALTDYMSVAIARKHSPSALLDLQDEDLNEGVAETICGLLRALNGPFHAEPGLSEMLENAAEQLNILTGIKPTPRLLNATISLNNWLREQTAVTRTGTATTNVYTLYGLDNDQHKECVLRCIARTAKSQHSEGARQSELRHAIELAGNCNLTEAIPLLLPLLKDDFSLLPQVVECLGKLGAADAAELIISLLERKLPLQSRWSTALSKHPVAEVEQADAVMYWTALKSLGSMPKESTFKFLASACTDHAPDKREVALLALSSVCIKMQSADQMSQFTEILRERLTDPSAQVRAAALKAIAEHNHVALLTESIKLINSAEVSLQRQCVETMSTLANSGHRQEVVLAAKSLLGKELDGARRERINRLLQSLQPV